MHNSFVENILEELSLKVEIPNGKKFILASIYQPNRHKTLTVAEQMQKFFDLYAQFIDKLDSFQIPVYLFTDMNIDLMKVGLIKNSNQIFDLSISHGLL